MLVIGCLCGSTLLWVAKSSLDAYLLALLTLFCTSGSQNVGKILVLICGRMPCYCHLVFCRFSRMLCPLLALRDFVPQTSGGPLYAIIALALDFHVVYVDMPILCAGSVLTCMWNASPIE